MPGDVFIFDARPVLPFGGASSRRMEAPPTSSGCPIYVDDSSESSYKSMFSPTTPVVVLDDPASPGPEENEVGHESECVAYSDISD